MNSVKIGGQRRDAQLANSNKTSYQLKSCKHMVKQDPLPAIAKSPGMGLAPTVKIMGLAVAGLHPRSINRLELNLSAQLNPGTRQFAGFGNDLRLKVKRDSYVHIFATLARSAQGELVVQELGLVFTKNIRIKNPASGLKSADSHESKTAIAWKDKLADVSLKSVRVDEQGNVFVNGHLKAARLLKLPLPDVTTKIDLPKIDEALLTSLGLLPETKAPQQKAENSAHDFDIKRVLQQLGAITQRINYSLKVTGDRSRMSFLKDNTYFRGPKALLDVALNGVVDLDPSGDLVLGVDGNNSHINCSLGKFVPDVKASFHMAPDGLTTMDLTAKLKGRSKSLKVDTFSKQAVKNMLPRQRQVDMTKVDGPTSENEFNAAFGAKKLKFETQADIRAEFDKKLKKMSGSASAKAVVRAPYGKTEDRGFAMDGRVSAYLDVQKLAYNQARGLEEMKGGVGFGLHPSKNTRASFPEMRNTKFDYGFSVTSGGRGRIAPPEYGITRFVRPIRNFEGHVERIDGSLTKMPLYDIGSKEYFAQVEKLTGAQLRKADKVKLLIDGVTSFPERLRLINEAKDYICFQTLAFKDDETGWLYAEALAKAAERGVRVYGIIDSLGNMEKLTGLDKPNPIYEYLKQNKVHLRIYNDSMEVGMRAIYGLVAKYPSAFNIKSPKSLKSIAQVLGFLERAIEVSENSEGLLSKAERLELKQAIHSLFNGKPGVSPEMAVSELKDALRGNMTHLEAILLLIKRVGEMSYRWHEKYLVVDHKAAIVGGMNIGDEYFKGGTKARVMVGKKEQPAWRDTDVLLEGDIAVDTYHSFWRNWLHIAQEKLPEAPKLSSVDEMASDSQFYATMMQHRPLEDGDHKVINFLLYNLRTLKPGEKAWFETAYFLPRGILRVLQKELVAAAKRGVDVRIITNSQATSDFESLVSASVFDLRELLEVGAKVYTRNLERMVHAKVMVLGDKLTMVGSWNCNNRSASHDSEDMCTIYHSGINQEMTHVLERDMHEQSDELTIKDIEQQKFSKEIMSAAHLLTAELL
ncbi:MAG TPA: phosphatidylserine/phosphatidylglycerophosphate/cardiolipin synthase family protein [Myxococcota bacterium]|nr:phosphatidylserine/phosphatidylglycerophosphate/cardiolipin synthase family protein [Myxococcota bacterium]